MTKSNHNLADGEVEPKSSAITAAAGISLNLGCGRRKIAGVVNLDITAATQPDVGMTFQFARGHSETRL